MRDNQIYIKHILDAIAEIEGYVRGFNLESFSENNMVRDAVVRQLEIIGEAAKQIDQATKESYPDVPWTQVVGMRNRLIHEYFNIDLENVWNVVMKDLPELKVKLNN